MKLVGAFAFLSTQCLVLAKLDIHGSRCEVRLETPLSDNTTFFNQFLEGARCAPKKYLCEDEKAIPYEEELPDVPVTANIDDQLTAFFDFIVGPESVAVVEEEDVAYTGASDGWIYKIDLLTMNATKFITACSADGVTSCRPQGIRVTSDKKIYFADLAGLCVYDIASDKVTVLVPRLSEVDGETIMLPNDLDVDEQSQMVYMSDGSTKYSNENILRGTLLHDNHGRVLAYDIANEKTSVLISGLSFPNGIQLAHDKKTLLVNEFNKRRVLQVPLDGDSEGKYEVFTPALPGEPDNIRAASNGGYWVALNLARNGNEKALYDYLGSKACATESFIKMNDFVAQYLRLVAETTENTDYSEVADKLSSYQFVSEMASHQGNFLQIDSTGKIVKRYTSDKFGFFSNPTEYKKKLIIGNDRDPSLVVVEGIL